MRIRSIKPEWLEDDRLLACSDAARMLSVALISMADDEGRGRLGVGAAARVWPTDPSKLDSAIKELEGWFVAAYEVRGQRYYAISNWAKHQKINRPSPSKIPAPNESFEQDSLRAHGGLTEYSLNTHGGITEASLSDQENFPTDSAGEKEPTKTGPEMEFTEGSLRPHGGFTAGSGPGREGKGSKTDTSKTSVSDRAPPERFSSEAQEAFGYWCHRMGKTRGAKLKGKRKTRVVARLRDGYTLDEIKRAIDGCASSSWHMGENDRGQRYDDLELICRDGTNLEKFRDMTKARKPAGNAARRLRDQLDQVRHRLRFVDPATDPDRRRALEAEETKLLGELKLAGAA